MKTPWAWLADVFARRGDDPTRQSRFLTPYLVAGVSLTPDEALSLSAVWACIDVIARAVASCKWKVYQPSGPNRRTLLVDDTLMWKLNTQPNPEMTAIGFREAMLFQAIPFGNAYAEIVKDKGGRVQELWPLVSERMTVRRDENWALVYDYLQPDGTLTRLEPRQVFHLRGPGLYGLLGENVVARAAKSMSVAAAQERYSASFFGQGASPSGVLETGGTLSADAHARLKKDWDNKHKGPENSHKTVILEAGMKFTPIAVDPQKSQLVEGRQFSVEEICRWFGVPPHKIQHLLRATFSNIEHSSIEFVRDALTPWARRLEQEADAKLFRLDRAPWKETEIDLSPLSRGDAASRAQAHASNRQNGIMTANEIRAIEGLDDIGPEGDVLLVQSNLTTVERLLEPPKPPPMQTSGRPALPAGDGADAGDGPDSEGQGDQAGAVAQLAREALELFVASSLDRYARKLAARRADLERKPHSERIVSEMMANARQRALDELRADLRPAMALAARALGYELELDVPKALDQVIAGEPAALAAVRALPATCLQTG